MLSAAEDWIRLHVTPIDVMHVERERPWATVLRVPVSEGCVWFKACAPVQAFEPHLTVSLFERWSDRVATVLAHDVERRWLLLADAGTLLGVPGTKPALPGAKPEDWLHVLPKYADLQRGEIPFATDHLQRGVPDLRVESLPHRFEEFLSGELPVGDSERRRLEAFVLQFARMCEELAVSGLPATIQHDDVHGGNLYKRRDVYRLLDWGDSSISHPFMSLVSNFRLLRYPEVLSPNDPRCTRLRDAYLEPWGKGHLEEFSLAMRVGVFAHAIAWSRQREAMPPEEQPEFDRVFHGVIVAAVQQIAPGVHQAL